MENLWETYGKLNKLRRTTLFDCGCLQLLTTSLKNEVKLKSESQAFFLMGNPSPDDLGHGSESATTYMFLLKDCWYGKPTKVNEIFWWKTVGMENLWEIHKNQ